MAALLVSVVCALFARAADFANQVTSAFNTPLGGIVFVLEEPSSSTRTPTIGQQTPRSCFQTPPV
jgi:hypothetical protein